MVISRLKSKAMYALLRFLNMTKKTVSTKVVKSQQKRSSKKKVEEPPKKKLTLAEKQEIKL